MRKSFTRYALGFALSLCTGFAGAQNPGAFDTSFDGDGRLDIKLVTAGTDDATRIVNYPDRRYVAIGLCADSSGAVPCLTRFNENGAADASFGSAGKVVTQLISGYRMSGLGVAVQPDGKILLAGRCQPTAGGSNLPCHVRLLANGQLDGSYGNAGSIVASIASNGFGETTGIAVQTDGKIVVAGHCFDTGHYFCVWRYSASGVADASYGTGGAGRVAIAPNNFAVRGLALTPDNQTIVYGYCDYASGAANICLVRFTASGVRDTAYVGGSGAPTLPHHTSGSAYEGPRSAVLQADGAIVMAGYCVLGSTLRVCATRVTTTGTLDTSFAGGWALPTHAALGAQSMAAGIALQRDGKLVLSAGCVDRYKVCVLRLNADGSLDDGYGNAGVMAVTSGGFATEVGGVLLDADERLLIAGGCYGNDGGGITDSCFWRLQRGQSYAGRSCSLDVDDDGAALTANDVLIMTRAAMGFSGSAVTAGITPSASARRTGWTAIRDYLFNQCGMTRVR